MGSEKRYTFGQLQKGIKLSSGQRHTIVIVPDELPSLHLAFCIDEEDLPDLSGALHLHGETYSHRISKSKARFENGAIIFEFLEIVDHDLYVLDWIAEDEEVINLAENVGLAKLVASIDRKGEENGVASLFLASLPLSAKDEKSGDVVELGALDVEDLHLPGECGIASIVGKTIGAV